MMRYVLVMLFSLDFSAANASISQMLINISDDIREINDRIAESKGEVEVSMPQKEQVKIKTEHTDVKKKTRPKPGELIACQAQVSDLTATVAALKRQIDTAALNRVALSEDKLKEVNIKLLKIAEMTEAVENEKLQLEKKIARIAQKKAQLKNLNILVTSGFATALLTAIVSLIGLFKARH